MPLDNQPESTEDPSQYSKMALNAKKAYEPSTPVQKLMNCGQYLVKNPAWKPQDGKTFCNFAVAKAAALLKGYKGFYDAKGQPLMANEIIRVMYADKTHWKQVSPQDAWDNALMGGLSVAIHSEDPHGHVALVAPTARVWSEKWSGYFPPVYNVGKTMNLQPPFTMGESYAFQYRPAHFVYVAL